MAGWAKQNSKTFTKGSHSNANSIRQQSVKKRRLWSHGWKLELILMCYDDGGNVRQIYRLVCEHLATRAVISGCWRLRQLLGKRLQNPQS